MEVYNSKKVPVGNSSVWQPIPNSSIKEGNPFLLLHHFEKKHIPSGKGFTVGAHPHRGFQPVSFVFDGSVQHKDSLGNNSYVNKGGVQWINSGNGIVHSEGMTDAFKKTGGDYEMIQLWVNLPSELKTKAATYNQASAEQMGKLTHEKYEIAVVSGEVNGITGPIKTVTNTVSAMFESTLGGEIELNYAGNTKIIYVLSGSINVYNTTIEKLNLIKLDNQNKVSFSFKENTRLLILGGNKINEPIKAYGPYVMNTQSEILQALNDFQDGKMGQLSDK